MPNAIQTRLGLVPGFVRQFTEKDQQVQQLFDFTCAIQSKPYIHEVPNIRAQTRTIAPTHTVAQKALKKSPPLRLDWSKTKDLKGECRFFAIKLAAKLPPIFTQRVLYRAVQESHNLTIRRMGIQVKPISGEFPVEYVTSTFRIAPHKRRNPYTILYEMPVFYYAFVCAKDPHIDEDYQRGLGMARLDDPCAIYQPCFARLRADYEPVTQLKPGDLVLFLREGVPWHMAYHVGGGRLKSKFGIGEEVYIHELGETGTKAGDQVVYWRRKGT